MSRRLMLVEDDPRVRAALSLALQDEGYDVVQAASGEQALALLEQAAPDVVLLDLVLPGIDGLEVCRRVREQSDLPVIMVTARAESADVVTGLQAGADDYVTKPLVAAELSARVQALLRRVQPQRLRARFGPLELVPDQGLALRNGERLHLTRTEFRLLCELASEPGRLVSREQLLERVWGYDYFGDTRLIDVHIRRLRTKVEDDPGDPQVILTVRGLGYRLQG